jgi:hypothetical protein
MGGTRSTARYGFVVAMALAACTEDPSPGGTASSTTHADGTATLDPSTSLETTAASTGPASTGPASTGPDPMAEPTDCDALRDQAACEALSGPEFQCVWFSDAYAVELDGGGCTVGEPIGWCVASGNGETGCVDDISYSCEGGGAVSFLFVREAEDGTTVLIQDMALADVEFGCLGPILWDECDGASGPAACACGCDPGLPQ